ncbi:MAG: MBL fold metallo-hydrolase [Candidatus Levybacteria bacterium]|nr:MBL fold metallo-hydrolase [Candidatus Levybacteria bacterium]
MSKFIISVLAALLLLGGIFWYQYQKFNDGKMHIIFCDVGQGDAVLIKTPGGKYILLDGGPDRSVLNCLAAHMPFWHRRIDLMLLTHPHADHFFGMFYVLERYDVKAFATEDLRNKTTGYEELIKRIGEKKISMQYALAGDTWDLGSVSVRVVGPTQKYLEQTSPGGTIGESREFASLITLVQYGAFDVLLTGDSQALGLQEALSYMPTDLEVLQSPHHGSGTGLDTELLEQLSPTLAVISVGAQNRYNHPHPKILALFTSAQIKVLRTDQVGAIELVSDGSDWKIVQ